MKHFLLLLLTSFIVLPPVQAQRSKEKLREFSKAALIHADENYEKAVAIAQFTGAPLQIESKNGERFYLRGISPEGKLQYLKSYNHNAAISTKADQFYKGGRIGINLKGKDMIAGVWEIGDPNLNHVEYEGRVIKKDAASSRNGRRERNHAAHVSGTIMAAGVRPDVRGMAYEAKVHAYTSQSDISEMAKAASDGLLISNHSYGLVRGWEGDQWYGNKEVSLYEDYLFGFYDNNAKQMDELAFEAPYYLIVKAAGNDRNNGPSSSDVQSDVLTRIDGPYDCIGSDGVAKNILTIGAVDDVLNYQEASDIKMSSFSSWGPTDDGRIKPDLVANGVSLTSVSAVDGSGNVTNNGYHTSSGTSMASPNATGSLLLVQELAHKLYGEYLKSATLKALAIHTASEAGSANGPDYSYGWGLLNVERAAKALKNKPDAGFMIEELTLEEEMQIQFTVSSDGSAPLMATIAWLDPAGTPVSAQLDPENLMLVNDLDIRITDEAGNEYLPWTLDPSQPAAAAVKGDNFRDNLEKVEILEPAPGTYTITISHKNTLVNGAQDFSLIVSAQALEDNYEELFWVGGTGNWSDTSHWSYTSGGQAADVVPGKNDRVIFDENSFDSSGQIVTLDQDAFCKSIYWSDAAAASLDFQMNDLTVYGAVNLDGEYFQYNGSGKLLVDSESENVIAVNVNDNSLKLPVQLVANSKEVQWFIDSDFSSSELTFNGGKLSVESNLIKVGSFKAVTGFDKLLSLDQSKLAVRDSLILTSGDLITHFSNSEITLENTDGLAVLEANELEVNKLKIIGAAEIKGNALHFDHVANQGEMRVYNSLSLDTLASGAGTTVAIQSGETIEVNVLLDLMGESESPVMIEAISDQPAYMVSDSLRRFCMDYLSINNIHVSGQTSFVAGENSQLTKAEGWDAISCANMLYADFEVEYYCSPGLLTFIDESTGNVENREWNLIKDGGLLATSGDKDPFFEVSDTGTYLITLTIESAEEENTLEKMIKVVESDIKSLEIENENGIFIASASANEFKWYLNGEYLSHITGGYYEGGNSLQGTLLLEATTDKCKAVYELELRVLNASDEIVNDEYKLFPNPSEDKLNIEVPGIHKASTIKVYNMLGTVVFEKELTNNSLQFDISAFEPGIYFVHINRGDVVVKKKFIKL